MYQFQADKGIESEDKYPENRLYSNQATDQLLRILRFKFTTSPAHILSIIRSTFHL